MKCESEREEARAQGYGLSTGKDGTFKARGKTRKGRFGKGLDISIANQTSLDP